MAERARKQEATTLTSIGAIAGRSRVKDQDSPDLDADTMVSELRDDNASLVESLKDLKEKADAAGDNATSALVDEWQDQAERRVWFLKQALA